MTARTEHIAADLRRIRAACPEDLAVLLPPLIQGLEGHAPGTSAHDLVAMAHSLAQVAERVADPDTALHIAGLADQVAALAPRELTQPARGAAARSPLALLFGLFGAAAVSYGVHVTAQARFAPGSLIGWLLSASTTLLAVAVTLRIGGFLARILTSRQLTVVSASIAALTGVFALSSVLINGPRLATTGHGETSPEAPTVSLKPPTPTAAPAAGDGVPAPPPPAEGATGVNMWWLGEGEPAPTTEIIDAEAVTEAAGAAAAPAQGDSPVEPARPRPTLRPAPAAPRATERYAELLDHNVRLVDAQGEVHVGLLTGVSKDAVTLRTEVRMFGQPIQAHRQFLHSAIRNLQAQ